MAKRDYIERFEIKYTRVGECDIWIGAKNKVGYGYFGFKGKLHLAHRVAWMLHNGEIPGGLWVLHSCDNPSCVRIEHLRLGTRKDNTNDMVKRGRHNNGYNRYITHGTTTGYCYHNCRCSECKNAKKDYDREYRNARKIKRV